MYVCTLLTMGTRFLDEMNNNCCSKFIDHVLLYVEVIVAYKIIAKFPPQNEK